MLHLAPLAGMLQPHSLSMQHPQSHATATVRQKVSQSGWASGKAGLARLQSGESRRTKCDGKNEEMNAKKDVKSRVTSKALHARIVCPLDHAMPVLGDYT